MSSPPTPLPLDGEVQLENPPIRVVALGASAGGLEALEIFFSHMPSDAGLSFVVVQHLSPDFKSVMDELLARRTKMKVCLATDGMPVEPNTIHLLPRKTEMTIRDGALRIAPQDPTRSFLLPIDTFFKSLAEDCGEHAIGIVLSGTGSDGSRGIRDIHQSGGLVFAQSLESAKFDGMPRAAVDTEIVDFILPPERMPEVLVAYVGGAGKGAGGTLSEIDEGEFAQVFGLLKKEHNIDFNAYKPSTMRRRIERRIVLGEYANLESYVKVLREDAGELEALLFDLLIGVTRFFRDEAAFALLRDVIIPEIIARKQVGDEVRAWVCGCATGEEAYSIAMLLAEAAGELPFAVKIKVFATDVQRRPLDHAARGIYTAEAVRKIPPDLCQKYFSRDGEVFRINPELRHLVVFSEHDLTSDPPFTKMDLVSCRNLLIYLRNPAQAKAIALFHFALNVGAVLMLGPSETLGTLQDEFEVIDNHWKTYRKQRDVRVVPHLQQMPPAISSQRVIMAAGGAGRGGVDGKLMRAYDSLLTQFMPPSVLLDESRRLLHSFGQVGKYFNLMEGRPSLDIVDMLGGDLRVAVAAALQRCMKESRRVTYQGIRHETPDGVARVNLLISPITDRLAGSSLYHIIFEENAPPEATTTSLPGAVVEDFELSGAPTLERIRDLELELKYSKEHLQTTVEELETSNEELQSTNEELLASNEELQSTNEELHSVNEELYTVNAEYEKKNRELYELNSDIDNLLRSTDIGTLFLDRNLEVRKFTPTIRIAFNLLPQDVGRSISDIAYRVLDHRTLREDSEKVLATKRSLDRRVRSDEGRDLLLRLRPYMTSQEEATGVVLTFVDVSELTEAQRRLEESEQRFRRIANSTPVLLWMVGPDLEGDYFNQQWTAFTGCPESAFAGTGWQRCVMPEDLPPFFAQCQASRDRHAQVFSEVRVRTGDGRWRWVRISGSPRYLKDGEFLGFVLSAVDIDDIRNAADLLRAEVDKRTEELRQSEEFFRIVGRTATDGYWDWNLAEDRLYLSPSFKRLFGYEGDELEDSVEHWQRLIHPEDQPKLEAALQEHREEGTPLNLIVRFYHREGHLKSAIVRGVALRDEKGVCDRIIGTHTDITAQKEAEAQLRASEARFRGVFETDLIGIGVVDHRSSLVEANDSLLKMIDLARADLPISIEQVSTPAGYETSLALIREASERGFSSIREKEYRKKSGGVVSALIGYSRLDHSSADLVVIAQDISSEKASLRALQRSEERLGRAVAATQVGLFDLAGPEAESLWCSDECRRIWGLDGAEGEVPTAQFLDQIHREDQPRVREALERVFAHGEEFNLDFRVFRAPGDERWIYSRGRVRAEGAGRQSGLVGTCQDVTERYASQASSRLKTEMLEKSNRDLEQFAYIASHDLKEPLRTVTGFLQILRARHQESLGEEASEFVLRAVNASHRMHALIDGLLEFSRIGRVDLRLEEIHLAEVVEIVKAQLQAAIDETGAVITCEDLPVVEGDLTMITQVFLNLIGNSIKFTGEEAPAIRIRGEEGQEDAVIVYLEDNGIGIDPKFAERIFVIFQRLHTREEYSGTGLGLSICRKIMERHDGRIWLANDDANKTGSRIALSFPRVDRP